MTDLINPLNLLILLIGGAISLLLGLRLAKDPSFGLVLMAFFLPFERFPSVDIAGFTFKLNHFIAALTFVFWLLAVMFGRRKIAPNPFAIPLILMFFSFLLSGLNAGDSFRQLTVYISLLIMLVIYITTINSLTSQKILQTIVGFLLLSAGLMSLLAIFQFFGDMAGLPTTVTGLDPGYTKIVFGFPRVHALSKEPLYFANYLFIPLGIALALFFSKQITPKVSRQQTLAHQIIDRLRGPWLLPLIILMLMVFFLTLSRGAFIALVPFALVFGFFYAKQIFTLKNVSLAILAAVISLSAVYTILDSVSYDAVDDFIGHATLEDVRVTKSGESGFGRLAAFEKALQAWSTAPVFGIGLGNYGPYVASYPLVKPIKTGWEIVNNEYLELLAETGIVGVATVALLLITVFGRSYQAYKATEDEYLKAVLVGLTAAMVGVFTQYNFFSTFYIIHIWVLIGLVVGVQNIILLPNRLPKD
jgi:O-antigen ligase